MLDWQDGLDRLDFSAFGFASAQEVLIRLADEGEDLVFASLPVTGSSSTTPSWPRSPAPT